MAKKGKSVTSLDVARVAGVSQSTVSMILNNSGYGSFTEETRQKVYQACIATGYRSIAPPKSKDSSKTILTVCPSCTNPDYMVAVETIQRCCLSHNYGNITLFSLREQQLEQSIIQTVSDLHVDGVIFLYKPKNAWLISNVEAIVPSISVCDREPPFNYDAIETNSDKIGEVIAQHLIDLGHEHIAYVASDLSDKYSLRINRLSGIKKTYKNNGYDPDDSVLPFSFESIGVSLKESQTDYESGFILANHIIDNFDITAFVGNNDMICFGIIDALQRKKKRIPQDYSVCGCDNTSLSNLKGLSLTSVDNYTTLRAAEAVKVLIKKIKRINNLDHMESPISTIRVEYSPKLISRASTGPARSKNK